jgi:hypothetical protein
MAVCFDLPPDIEHMLRQSLGDLDQAAKEAALVELYRHQKLSQFQLAQALGLSRLEAEELLKRHHVTEDLPTPSEIEQDVQALRRLLQR